VVARFKTVEGRHVDGGSRGDGWRGGGVAEVSSGTVRLIFVLSVFRGACL
jgi:hypothetical protein